MRSPVKLRTISCPLLSLDLRRWERLSSSARRLGEDQQCIGIRNEKIKNVLPDRYLARVPPVLVGQAITRIPIYSLVRAKVDRDSGYFASFVAVYGGIPPDGPARTLYVPTASVLALGDRLPIPPLPVSSLNPDGSPRKYKVNHGT